jgi:hypothetical protein
MLCIVLVLLTRPVWVIPSNHLFEVLPTQGLNDTLHGVSPQSSISDTLHGVSSQSRISDTLHGVSSQKLCKYLNYW